MAHIQKRGKRYKARYRGPDGCERSRMFDRRVDAERWLATSTADIARGDWVDPKLGRMTFGEWVKKWEKTLDLRPTTRALNLHVTHKYLLPRFETWPLSRITTSDIKAMLADDLTRGDLSNSAIRRHVMVLSTILAAAVVDGRIARNPCRGIKLPAEDAREMRFLEPEQVIAVSDAAGTHYRPIVLTAAFVGLRFGELAGLAVDRVNLLRRTIRIDRQLIEVGRELSFGPPKTKAGIRTVTIPAALCDVLAQHFGSVDGLAFPNVNGDPLRRSSFRRVWRGACARAGFEDGPLAGLHFHELRHTAVALAVREGAHPLAIKERLGHASIQTTLDTYGGLFPSLDEAIADGLDRTMREAIAAYPRPETASEPRLRRLGA